MMTPTTTPKSRRTTSAETTRLRPVLVVLLCAFFVVLAGPRTAHADEDAHETLRDFTRSGQYTLYISGKTQKGARIYHSSRAGAFLVLESDYGKPFLILPREKAISVVASDMVVNVTKKRADLAKDAKPEKLGSFKLQRRDILINLKGLVARLHPSAYALGALKREELLLHTPDYERGAKRYRPNSSDVQKLIDCALETEVTIFFGTWCPTCKRLLPRILRVDQAIKGSKINITYYGLPKGKSMRTDPEASKQRVTRVPTGVMFVNGRRVGTITSRAMNRPERALCLTLQRRR